MSFLADGKAFFLFPSNRRGKNILARKKENNFARRLPPASSLKIWTISAHFFAI